MARALPKLDTGRPYAAVLPPSPDGTAFKQGKGDAAYHFTANGECVVAALTEKQKALHFGGGQEAPSLIGSSILPDKVALNDTTSMALGDIVARAHRDSGLSVAGWNDLPEAERERLLQVTVDDLKMILKPAEPAPRKSTVGTVPDKAEGKVEKKEPAKFAPIVPDPDKPEAPAAKAENGVDLRAWMDGRATYNVQEVIAEVKKRYGRGCRTGDQVRTYLREEQGF